MTVKENEFMVRQAATNFYRNTNLSTMSERDLLTLVLGALNVSKREPLGPLIDQLLLVGLRELSDMSEVEISLKFRLPVPASQLLMSFFELGRRVAANWQPGTIIRSPADVYELLKDMQYYDREHFVVLYLSTKNHVISKETLAIGSLNAAVVHPREVFRSAIRRGAASIICCHNHPSTDSEQSAPDVELTGRLVESGNLVGIEVLDHVIIGRENFTSLKERGFL